MNLLNSIQYRNEIDHKIDLRVKRQLRRERKLPPGVFIAHLSTEGQLKKKNNVIIRRYDETSL